MASRKAKQLVKIFKSGSTWDCIDFFVKNDCTDDEEIQTIVQEWCEIAYSCRTGEAFAKKAKLDQWPLYVNHREVFLAAEFALGKLNEKTVSAADRASWECLYAIGIRHGDKWITKWCEYLVKDSFRNWELLRRFYLKGLCPRPEDDGYYLALMLKRGGEKRDMVAFLRENPDLLEYDIWKFFEIEGTSECSMGVSHHSTDWNENFKQLSDDGTISRARLLESSLQTLTRDFIQFRAGWYSRFHEYLKPTLEERETYKDYYLKLCSSPIGPTVSFALKAVALLEKKGKITADEIIQYLPPALNSKTKSTVKKVIGLFDKQIAKSPEKIDLILELVCQGFCHESPDVQEYTLEILQKHNLLDRPNVVKVVQEYIDILSPTIQAQLKLAEEEEVKDSLPSLEDLKQRAASIPTKQSSALGISYLLSCLEENKEVEITKIDWREIGSCWWQKTSDFVPIETIDELIADCQLSLEHPEDIVLLERVLEALGRIGHDKPSDFAKKTKSLLKRCQRGGRDFDYHYEIVFIAWITGEVPSIKKSKLIGAHPLFYRVWIERLLWIAKMVAKNKPFSFISTPTHGSWLSPQILRERLGSKSMNEEDVAVALMRTEPTPDLFSFIREQNIGGKVTKIAAVLEKKSPIVQGSLTFTRRRASQTTWISLDSQESYIDNEVKETLNFSSIDYFEAGVYFPFLSSAFPHHPELICLAINRLHSSYYSWVEGGVSRILFYQQMNNPKVPFDHAACLMLGTGLFSLDKYLRQLTSDLLVDAIEDGRMGVKELQLVLVEFCRDGFAICKRVVPAFRTAMDISLIHAVVIRDAIIGCIKEIKELPRDFHVFLEVLCDLLVLSGSEIKDTEVRDVLAQWQGSNKLGKLAKSILKYQETAERKKFNQEVVAALLEQRVQKYETRSV